MLCVTVLRVQKQRELQKLLVETKCESSQVNEFDVAYWEIISELLG